MSKQRHFLNYRKFAKKAAKELNYSDDILKRIDDASSDAQIEHIMNQERKKH